MSQMVLVKNLELHGGDDTVEPTAVPFSAYEAVWRDKGFSLVDRTGKEVDSPEAADPAAPDAPVERPAKSTSSKSRVSAGGES